MAGILTRAATPEQLTVIEDLTGQILDRLAGVQAGIAIEAALRAVVIATISMSDDRGWFDRQVASWPTRMGAFADENWLDVRAQAEAPISPAERRN